MTGIDDPTPQAVHDYLRANGMLPATRGSWIVCAELVDLVRAATADYYNDATQTRSTTPGVPTPQNDPERPAKPHPEPRNQQQETNPWPGQTPSVGSISPETASSTAPPATKRSAAPAAETDTASADGTATEDPAAASTPPTPASSRTPAAPGTSPAPTTATTTSCPACRHRPHPGSICSANLDGPAGSHWAYPCGCAGPNDTQERDA